jgi:hypothetical protein
LSYTPNWFQNFSSVIVNPWAWNIYVHLC